MINPQENYSLEDVITNVSGAYFISDTHQTSGMIRNTIKKAAANDSVMIHGGDASNDVDNYGRGPWADITKEAIKRGYKFYSQLESEFMLKSYEQGRLSEDEFNSYLVQKIAEINKTDTKSILEHLTKENQLDEFRSKRLESMLQSEVLGQKIKNLKKELFVNKDFQYELKKVQNLYLTFVEEEAKVIADEYNENPEVRSFVLNGNHETILTYELVKKYLKNKNQITIIDTEDKLYTFKLKNNQELTLTGDTNCLMDPGYLHEIFPEGTHTQLVQHMYKNVTEDNIISGDYSIEDLKMKNFRTPWYDNILKALNGRTLDILLLHGEIGKPQFGNGKMGHDVPVKADVAMMSLNSKYIIAGHIHKKFEGKSNLGTDFVRLPGNDALYITKDENGEIIKKWEPICENYGDVHENPSAQPLEYYFDKVESIMEASNEENYTDSEFESTAKAA